MKKIVICTAFFLVAFLCFSQKEGIEKIERNNKGIITSVIFSESESARSPHSAQEFFTQYLKVKETDFFKKIPHKSKRPNFVHEHYDQYYNGVKVEGAGYNLHYKNGQMYFANGNYMRIENLSAHPTLSQEEAIRYFLEYKNIDKQSVTSNITELIVKEIIQKSGEKKLSIELVYRIYLQSDHVNNDEIGFVNAHTGEVIATEPRLTDLTGTFATRYSGSRQAETDPVAGNHRLFDNTRGAVIHTQNMQNNTTIIANAVELIDNDNDWTAAEHSANNNDMGLDVHWALQEIYDYLDNTHSIKSFNNDDDDEEPINAYIRYGTNNGTRDNASWDLTLDVMYFGQGVSTFNPLASIDVVSHEFGHGITDFQIGWIYSGDRASFHEGMSDIWAAILEHRIRPSATWRIGEQVMANGKSYLRNLQNTNDNNAHQKIANTLGSSQYNSGGIYERSGVFSHWFYLLVNGGTGVNGISDSYSVNGISLDIAEDIIMEAVFNNYLDGTTTYAQIRTAIIAATTTICDNLNVLESVTNAWHAVGVGDPYDGLVSNITSTSSEICSDDPITFTLNNVPVGTTVTWSASPSYLFNTSSGSGSSATLSPASSSSSGSATITFTISSICQTVVSQELWIGKTQVDFINFSNSVDEYEYFCSSHTGNSFVVDSDTPDVIYQARLLNFPSLSVAYTSPSTYSGNGPHNWNYIPIPNNGFYVFQVKASNTCGTTDWLPGWEVEYIDCSGFGESFLAIFPNPATSSLNIERISTQKSRGANMIKLELSNDNGETKLVQEINLNEKQTIDISELPSGIYILNLFFKDKVESRRIKIVH